MERVPTKIWSDPVGTDSTPSLASRLFSTHLDLTLPIRARWMLPELGELLEEETGCGIAGLQFTDLVKPGAGCVPITVLKTAERVREGFAPSARFPSPLPQREQLMDYDRNLRPSKTKEHQRPC